MWKKWQLCIWNNFEKETISKYIGICYSTGRSTWGVRRWSAYQNKLFYNGCYDDEETAAHASDTLARKLMENGEQKLKLNFPDDYTEVYADEVTANYFLYGKFPEVYVSFRLRIKIKEKDQKTELIRFQQKKWCKISSCLQQL